MNTYASWSWRCNDCGHRYPSSDELHAVKTDAEVQWRHHKRVCPGPEGAPRRADYTPAERAS